MKKITLLSALFVAGLATAQVQVAPEQMKLTKMEPQRIEMNKGVTLEEWNPKTFATKNVNAEYDLVDHYVVGGMMYGGLTPEWGGYVPMMMVPAYKNIVFENIYGPTTWSINGTVDAENSEMLEYGLLGDGMYYLPATSDHVWQVDDTTSYNVKGYMYGAGQTAQYLIAGANHMVASDGIVPLTLCQRYCDVTYSANGRDFYAISAESLNCPYAYGTDLVYEGKSMDTIVSVVENVSPLKIEQINIAIYHQTDGALTTMLPEGAEVKVELIAADLEQGIIYNDSVYASTIVAFDDCVDLSGGSASLVAKFYEEDIFGGQMEVAVVIPGDFVCQITGYNETNCDFGFIADYYNPVGSTLFVENGEYTPFWGGTGGNLAISYVAYWPTVYNPSETNVIVAPVEGGVAMDGEYDALTLYTNVYDVENLWIIDAPEWVEYITDATYLESDGALLMQVTAEALPAGEAYRQGIITIDADGYVLEIVVNQGDVPSAIEDVVAPVFNNKRYNLLGVEVDENYKGVVIMNGKKFIQ